MNPYGEGISREIFWVPKDKLSKTNPKRARVAPMDFRIPICAKAEKIK